MFTLSPPWHFTRAPAVVILVVCNVNILAFLESKWQKTWYLSLLQNIVKGLYIALVSQNLRLVKIKTSVLITLLTFAQVSIQWVIAITCCTVSRNIAVAAVFNVTPCCKKESENFQSFVYTANYLLSHWNSPVVSKHELAFRFWLAQNNQSSTAYEKSISLMFTFSCTKIRIFLRFLSQLTVGSVIEMVE